MPAVLPALAEVAKNLREDRRVKPERVAVAADKSGDTVRLFEKGEQGQHIDLMANAYAEAASISVFDLWRRAVDLAESRATQPAVGEGDEKDADRLARAEGGSAESRDADEPGVAEG